MLAGVQHSMPGVMYTIIGARGTPGQRIGLVAGGRRGAERHAGRRGPGGAGRHGGRGDSRPGRPGSADGYRCRLPGAPARDYRPRTARKRTSRGARRAGREEIAPRRTCGLSRAAHPLAESFPSAERTRSPNSSSSLRGVPFTSPNGSFSLRPFDFSASVRFLSEAFVNSPRRSIPLRSARLLSPGTLANSGPDAVAIEVIQPQVDRAKCPQAEGEYRDTGQRTPKGDPITLCCDPYSSG